MSGHLRPAGRANVRRRTVHNLVQAVLLFTLAGTAIGPLTPTAVAGEAEDADDSKQETKVERSNGRVVEAAPAPITTPAGGAAGPAADPTVEGEPLFLPYTPPDDVTELPDERTRQTRTLANPDGTFTLEASNGPL
jgi:hypothetical protein